MLLQSMQYFTAAVEKRGFLGVIEVGGLFSWYITCRGRKFEGVGCRELGRLCGVCLRLVLQNVRFLENLRVDSATKASGAPLLH